MWQPSRRQGNLRGLARAVQQSARPTKYKCGSARACTHMLIFQAHVHVHRRSWCPVPQPTVGGAGHSRHGQGNHAADSDSRRVFSHERRKTPIHLVSGFQFLAQLVARLVSSCRQSLDSKCWKHRWSHQLVPHTCRSGRGQKPDIIDYFLVSTLIRPLIQRCEVVKSVAWGPHYGVRVTLNIDFESVVSRQIFGTLGTLRNHNTEAPHARQVTDQAEVQHSGTKQDADAFLMATSHAVKTGKKSPRWHAPNT